MIEALGLFRESNTHGHLSFHFHYSESPTVYWKSRLFQRSVSQRSHDFVAIQQSGDSSTFVTDEGVLVAESLVPRFHNFIHFVFVLEERANKVRAPVGLRMPSFGNDNLHIRWMRRSNGSFLLILLGFNALVELDWIGLEDCLTPAASGLYWFDFAAFSVSESFDSLFHGNLQLLACLRQDVRMLLHLLQALFLVVSQLLLERIQLRNQLSAIVPALNQPFGLSAISKHHFFLIGVLFAQHVFSGKLLVGGQLVFQHGFDPAEITVGLGLNLFEYLEHPILDGLDMTVEVLSELSDRVDAVLDEAGRGSFVLHFVYVPEKFAKSDHLMIPMGRLLAMYADHRPVAAAFVHANHR